jgi:NitT/TauT family transport system substrate-binding protein
MIGRREFRPISRRKFVAGTGLVAATAGGYRPLRAGAEPLPETTRIRLSHAAAICTRHSWVVSELLQAEGFTDVQYEDRSAPTTGALPGVASGAADLGHHLQRSLDPANRRRSQKIGHVLVNNGTDRPGRSISAA